MTLKGLNRVYSTAPRLAPLRITTPSGRTSFFVKLVDAATDEPIMTMFIRGGQTFETRVPLGSMQMRYASGAHWEDEDTLFGPETVYKRAERRLDFVRESNGRVFGQIVELIGQAEGSYAKYSSFLLQASEIDRTEF